LITIGTSCTFIVIAWRTNLHVVHGVDFVFINAAPANNNRRVPGLRKFNLSDESLHDLQRFGQRTGVELRDWTPHTHDVDVGKFFKKSASRLKILSRKIYKCQWRPGI
jgi:alkyl sulfatase BDS1-like metallo-beta-lactamase superfamily hydrolase